MFSPHNIAKGTTVALALGAIAAPAASAMPIGGIPTTAGPAPAQLTGSHPFGPNRTVPVAAATPTAVLHRAPAGWRLDPSAFHPTYSRQDKQLVPSSPTQAPAPAAPTVVSSSTPNSGFEWGDAAIGAGGGIVLSIVAIGGALGIQRSRKATIRTSAPVAAS
jgi:hypothetical protein